MSDTMISKGCDNHNGTAERVLVTGASGFVGGHLVQRLVSEGKTVTALVRPRSRIAPLPLDRITLACGDLRDIESLRRAVQGVDLVIHAGAATRGPLEEHAQSTIAGTHNMLRASLEAGVRRFIHISTLAVYAADERDALIDEEYPCERDPARVGKYAWAKSEAERHASQFHERGLPTVVLRPGLIYGPGRLCGRGGPVLPPHVGYRVPGFGGRLFMLIGDGENLLPLTYIDNVIDAVMLAATSEGAPGKAYNIVDEEPVTQRRYLDRCMQMAGSPQIVVPIPMPVLLCAAAIAERVHRLGRSLKGAAVNGTKTNGGPPTPDRLKRKFRSMRVSALKARTQLGWSPRVDFEEGVRRMFSDSIVQ